MNFDEPKKVLISASRHSGVKNMIKHFVNDYAFEEKIIVHNLKNADGYKSYDVIYFEEISYECIFKNYTQKKILVLDSVLGTDPLPKDLQILLKFNKQFNITIIIVSELPSLEIGAIDFDYILKSPASEESNKHFHETVSTHYLSSGTFNTLLNMTTKDKFSFMCIDNTTASHEIISYKAPYTVTVLEQAMKLDDLDRQNIKFQDDIIRENSELKARTKVLEMKLFNLTNILITQFKDLQNYQYDDTIRELKKLNL